MLSPDPAKLNPLILRQDIRIAAFVSFFCLFHLARLFLSGWTVAIPRRGVPLGVQTEDWGYHLGESMAHHRFGTWHGHSHYVRSRPREDSSRARVLRSSTGVINYDFDVFHCVLAWMFHELYRVQLRMQLAYSYHCLGDQATFGQPHHSPGIPMLVPYCRSSHHRLVLRGDQ